MEYVNTKKEITKWDQRFIKLSKNIAEWSKDPNAKVGSIIVSPRKGPISTGFNGFPIGVEDSAERLKDKDTKLELIVHAEQNAIINAGLHAENSTIYVWGKPICARCAGSIIQAGISRVVALSPKTVSLESKWRLTGELSLQMFMEANIQVDFFDDSLDLGN